MTLTHFCLLYPLISYLQYMLINLLFLISYCILLIKPLIDLCEFSWLLTSVSIICNICLWFLVCSLLFLNIPSSFPLCTSSHNSLNLTYLKKNALFSQQICSLDSSTAKNGHQNWLLNWIISSMLSLSFLVKKWSRITFPCLGFVFSM